MYYSKSKFDIRVLSDLNINNIIKDDELKKNNDIENIIYLT